MNRTILGTIDKGGDGKTIICHILGRMYGIIFNPNDFEIAAITKLPDNDGSGRNTTAEFVPYANSIHYGARTLFYNRIHVDDLGTIRVLKGTATHVHELLETINVAYGIYLKPSDVVNEVLPSADGDGKVEVELRCTDNSIVFYSGLRINNDQDPLSPPEDPDLARKIDVDFQSYPSITEIKATEEDPENNTSIPTTGKKKITFNVISDWIKGQTSTGGDIDLKKLDKNFAVIKDPDYNNPDPQDPPTYNSQFPAEETELRWNSTTLKQVETPTTSNGGGKLALNKGRWTTFGALKEKFFEKMPWHFDLTGAISNYLKVTLHDLSVYELKLKDDGDGYGEQPTVTIPTDKRTRLNIGPLSIKQNNAIGTTSVVIGEGGDQANVAINIAGNLMCNTAGDYAQEVVGAKQTIARGNAMEYISGDYDGQTDGAYTYIASRDYSIIGYGTASATMSFRNYFGKMEIEASSIQLQYGMAPLAGRNLITVGPPSNSGGIAAGNAGDEVIIGEWDVANEEKPGGSVGRGSIRIGNVYSTLNMGSRRVVKGDLFGTDAGNDPLTAGMAWEGGPPDTNSTRKTNVKIGQHNNVGMNIAIGSKTVNTIHGYNSTTQLDIGVLDEPKAPYAEFANGDYDTNAVGSETNINIGTTKVGNGRLLTSYYDLEEDPYAYLRAWGYRPIDTLTTNITIGGTESQEADPNDKTYGNAFALLKAGHQSGFGSSFNYFGGISTALQKYAYLGWNDYGASINQTNFFGSANCRKPPSIAPTMGEESVPRSIHDLYVSNGFGGLTEYGDTGSNPNAVTNEFGVYRNAKYSSVLPEYANTPSTVTNYFSCNLTPYSGVNMLTKIACNQGAYPMDTEIGVSSELKSFNGADTIKIGTASMGGNVVMKIGSVSGWQPRQTATATDIGVIEDDRSTHRTTVNIGGSKASVNPSGNGAISTINIGRAQLTSKNNVSTTVNIGNSITSPMGAAINIGRNSLDKVSVGNVSSVMSVDSYTMLGELSYPIKTKIIVSTLDTVLMKGKPIPHGLDYLQVLSVTALAGGPDVGWLVNGGYVPHNTSQQWFTYYMDKNYIHATVVNSSALNKRVVFVVTYTNQDMYS